MCLPFRSAIMLWTSFFSFNLLAEIEPVWSSQTSKYRNPQIQNKVELIVQGECNE